MSSPPSGFSIHGSAKAPVYVNGEAKEGGSSSNPNVQNVPLALSPMNREANEGGSSSNPNVQNAPLALSPMIGNAVNYFPDLFETLSSADPSLDFGYFANPTPIKTSNVVAPIISGQKHPSTHALFKIQSSLGNLISMAPLLVQSARNLLLEGGDALPTATWYGHDFIRDVQLLQRNICIFSDAIGVINSQDVVITNVEEMKYLVRLKIAGLWNEAVIFDGLDSARPNISQLALDNNITVRAI